MKMELMSDERSIDWLLETPLSEKDSYRMDVLVALEKLERLDKDQFTEDEKNDAQEEKKRLEEEARVVSLSSIESISMIICDF